MRKCNPFFQRLLVGFFFGGVIFFIQAHFLVANDTRFIYDSKQKRDPFVPLIGKNVTMTDVELLRSIEDVRVEGVILDPAKGSAAIVNGQILRIGEFLGGFRLERVTRYEIFVSRDGQEYRLQFRNKDDDQPVFTDLR